MQILHKMNGYKLASLVFISVVIFTGCKKDDNDNLGTVTTAPYNPINQLKGPVNGNIIGSWSPIESYEQRKIQYRQRYRI